MKKKILILLFMFLLTGCAKVEYNLIIEDNKITEEIVIPYSNSKEKKEELKELIKTKQTSYYSSGDNKNYYYDTSITESADKKTLLLTYKYDYAKSDLINSEAINGCFYKKDFIDKNDGFIIQTGEISCLMDEYGQIVDELVVNIKTDYNVTENNADEVNGNTYTWYFNNYNHEYQNIYLEANTDIEEGNGINIKMDIILIIISVVALISIIVLLIIYLKNRKNNQI